MARSALLYGGYWFAADDRGGDGASCGGYQQDERSLPAPGRGYMALLWLNSSRSSGASKPGVEDTGPLPGAIDPTADCCLDVPYLCHAR